MNKPVALIDCDGVLCDFLSACLKLINDFYHTSHTLDSLNQWDIFDALGISKEARVVFYDMMKRPGWCLSLEPFPDAADGIELLSQFYDVHILTTPMITHTWAGEREAWLWKHLGIPSKKVIHAHAKYLVDGAIFIDDKPEHLHNWRKHRKGVPIMWKGPGNHVHDWDGFTASHWHQVIQLLACIKSS